MQEKIMTIGSSRRTRILAPFLLALLLLAPLQLAPLHGRAAPLPASGLWLPAALPPPPYFGGPATALPDGTVLVHTARYDPATDSWSAGSPPPRVGQQYTAALLADGRVLAVGGIPQADIYATDGAALYIPATGTWLAAASMSSPRVGQTMTRLGDGSVLVSGGFAGIGVAASAERYLPASDAWVLTGPMATARAYQSATLLADGRVLVVGGADRTTSRYATAEIYDPATNAWTVAAPPREPRSIHSATRLADGRVLVAGGSGSQGYDQIGTAELYDPATNTWRAAADLPEPRRGQTATLLNDGTVLLVGGNFSAAVARYDPASDRWLPTFGLRTKAGGQTATLLRDGTVLLVDGGVAERFDPTAAVPRFADVPPSAPGYEAITQLAGRGIIHGYGDGTFGPGDRVLRAQVAALLVRGVWWQSDRYTPGFPDRDGVDDELWRAVGSLAYHKVALGYADGTYNPTGPVLRVQVISLVARLQLALGYWERDGGARVVYPNVPKSSGARDDLAQYVARAGALPDEPDPGQVWSDWDQPATREWTARVIWQAFNSPGGASR
jgi:hypothetical protein